MTKSVFYPSQMPNWILKDERRAAEIKVFHKLQSILTEDWTIFYSRPWWGLNSTGGEKDGEADFILAHPEKGLLFLEVKGGKIEYDSKKELWTSTDRHSITHVIKNPINQAMTCRHQILTKLKGERNWPSHRVIAHYGVVFVDSKKTEARLIGGYESELFCHAVDFDERFSEWIEARMSSHVSINERGPGDQGILAMIEVLAKPILLRTTLSRNFGADLENMNQLLTGIQFQVLGEIEASNRIVIEGGAGTGKTVIAVESAIRSAESGKSTLICCVGEGLLNEFKKRLIRHSNNLDICTVSEAAQLAKKFDTVIIDESQDVDWNLWDKLSLLLKDQNSKLICFMDANQAIYRLATDLQTRLQAKSFTLRVNLRNTKNIGDVIEKLYKGPSINIAGPDGEKPVLSIVKSAENAIDAICKEILELNAKEGVRFDEIAILSADTNFVRKMAYALNNARILNSSGSNRTASAVTLDTILNFKGLEAPVVIAYCPLEYGNNKELSYVGASRARTYLHVYASDPNSSIAQAVKGNH